MARKLKSDRVLFIATILLVGLSIVMVYSASAVVALERYQRPYLFLTKQIMWAVLGMAVLGLVMRVDYRTYRQPAFIWTCLGVVVLGLVAVLFSAPVNNARRWLGVGGLGVQPSELAKLSAIFFIAALLARRLHVRGDGGGAGPGRRSGRVDLLLRDYVARPSSGAARARPLRRAPRARTDDDDRGAGVCDHPRRARVDADQGDSAAVRQCR